MRKEGKGGGGKLRGVKRVLLIELIVSYPVKSCTSGQYAIGTVYRKTIWV